MNSGFRGNKAGNILSLGRMFNTSMPRHLRIQENKVCLTLAEIDSHITYMHGVSITYNEWIDREDAFCSYFSGNPVRVGTNDDITLSRGVLSFTYTNLELKGVNIEHNTMSSPQPENTENAIQMLDNYIIQALPWGPNTAAIEATSITFHESTVIKNNVAAGMFGLFTGINDDDWQLDPEYYETYTDITQEGNVKVPGGEFLDFCLFSYYAVQLTSTLGQYDDYNTIVTTCQAL